jgi:hypothetical protein
MLVGKALKVLLVKVRLKYPRGLHLSNRWSFPDPRQGSGGETRLV